MEGSKIVSNAFEGIGEGAGEGAASEVNLSDTIKGTTLVGFSLFLLRFEVAGGSWKIKLIRRYLNEPLSLS